ncbi:LL-diaminopimelate aminotransferase [Paenibacillus bouchesdurhonensis]|uniref:LL-diaminopimelate aminotransferase n=1 Tax=Paenibacillus bouchesdurhonensis TaxID=1870990 RepID=UPI000DA633AC|nr:LL-diaminopimelate aminotransferase [Paenibacillus bouchesdurhonensis]
MNQDPYKEAYIMQKLAERIGGADYGKDTAIYKFEKIKRAKAAASMEFPDIELIDMGVGEPDEMADPAIVSKLSEEAAKPENRGYADNGIVEFKQAAALYLRDVFGVQGIDPTSEIVHSIGSKPALAMLPYCFINPGDLAILTIPGYPVLGTHTKYLGGEVYNLPLTEENAFLPDLETIPEDIARKAKLLYLNYPNNPTGASATYEFFAKVVEWARKNKVIVVHDAPYAALTFDGFKPLSFLSVSGAKEVGVELHSLSKSYNMTGWRIGFVAGNPLIVKAFSDVKDNCDSGQFIAIQKAAAYALVHPELTKAIAAKYSRRHELLVNALNEIGFQARKPQGSFFLYVKAPKGIKGGETFRTAEDFSQYLIRRKLISTVPWDEAGSYVRFSVTFIAKGIEEEKEVIAELKRRLGNVAFEH